jgi:hypothetical protein
VHGVGYRLVTRDDAGMAGQVAEGT